MKITLDNGIILDNESKMAKSLNEYAKMKDLNDIRVFLAVHPNKDETYLIVDGEIPTFESRIAEDIAVHLDMMSLVKE